MTRRRYSKKDFPDEYFPLSIHEWIFTDAMSDSDIQPDPEVPDGLVERTIDACHEEAPFEVAKYADPDKGESSRAEYDSKNGLLSRILRYFKDRIFVG